MLNKKISLLFVILVMLLSACSRSHTTKSQTIITLEKKPVVDTLYYSGTVKPLATKVIASPADGVVVDMPFQYGEKIKKGDTLFVLSSTKFINDYKTALMQYVKVKSDFNNSKTQLAEAQFLHKNQLISDDEFKLKQSNFYASQLALLQAKDTLQTILNQLEIKNINLYDLTIADIDKISEAMNLKISAENLRIVAPTDGIVLAATKNEEENKKIVKGDVVKQGDLLAMIGDMSGMSVKVNVNELVVNQLHVGQKVKVSGIAFSNYDLNGCVERVDHQGEISGGGLPTFPVEVSVPTLTAQEQKVIQVGMSAKVEINRESEPKLSIPISALIEKNGESFVNLYDAKKKSTQLVAIRTGTTTLDSVTVQSGLKAGDQIVVPA